MNKLIHLIALTVLGVAAAQADIIITLDDPNQTGSEGQTLSFYGTIMNTDPNSNDAPVVLAEDNLNFSLTDATQNDDFFTNVPASLASGASSGDIDLFDYTLANPETLPLGTYTGTYFLQDANSNILAQESFSVDVTTPEPASFALIGVGLALAGWSRRSRRNRSA
jgi:hypothetical protein